MAGGRAQWATRNWANVGKVLMVAGSPAISSVRLFDVIIGQVVGVVKSGDGKREEKETLGNASSYGDWFILVRTGAY